MHRGEEEEQEPTISPEEEAFEDSLNCLSERRAASRDKGLTNMTKLLSTRWSPDLLEKNWETLADLLCRLTRNGPEEAVKAAQALSILSITIGREQALYNMVTEALSRVISTEGVADAAASASVQTMGNVCFFSSTDPNDTLVSMEFLRKQFSRTGNAARTVCSSVTAWSLLATSLSLQMIPSILSKYGNTFMELLDHDDVDVRIESGHTLALLFSMLRELHEENGTFSLEDCNEFLDTDMCITCMEELIEGGVHSKKDRLKQSPEFRLILKSIVDGDIPEEKLTVKFQSIKFTGWAQMTQLWRLREALSAGLPVHLLHNQVLHELFDIRLDPTKLKERLTATEKRLTMSPNSARSKAKTQKRNFDRANRNAMKQYDD